MRELAGIRTSTCLNCCTTSFYMHYYYATDELLAGAMKFIVLCQCIYIIDHDVYSNIYYIILHSTTLTWLGVGLGLGLEVGLGVRGWVRDIGLGLGLGLWVRGWVRDILLYVSCIIYMFRANCQFTQFRNCVAHFRDRENAYPFRNCVRDFEIAQVRTQSSLAPSLHWERG